MKISNTGSSEKKVTVFGLGLMGSGIARAFIANGYSVTVWNRDLTKAASLLSRGAVLAKDPNEAIVASPLLVICVSDYKVTHKIFSSVDVTLLKDRTIIQLSSGTPKEARSFDGWIQKLGGSSLNGDILAWPAQIGSSEATITISGSKSVFEKSAAALKALGGTVEFVGEESGASAVMFSAAMAYLAGSWIGFTHGALIMESEGMRADTFGNLAAGMSSLLEADSIHMGEAIQQGKFGDPESTIHTTALDLHLLVQHSKEAGISAMLPTFAANLFQLAVDAGYGKEKHAAIIKVLRQPE